MKRLVNIVLFMCFTFSIIAQNENGKIENAAKEKKKGWKLVSRHANKI